MSMYSPVSTGEGLKSKNSSSITVIKSQKNRLSDWIIEFSFKIVIIGALIILSAKISSLKHEQQLINNALAKISNMNKQKNTQEIKSWQELIAASSIEYPREIEETIQVRQRRRQGIDKNIQLGSQLDYLRINQSYSFQIFKQNYLRLTPHEVLKFDHDQKLQKSLPQLKGYKYFKSPGQIEQFLLQNSRQKFISKFFISDVEALLASSLQWQQNDEKILEAEYIYYDSKYNLSSIKQQLPICIISTGYNLYTKDKYKQYFQSIERQNYTNFQIVLVDDHSPDGSAQHFYQYLKTKDFRLKNRLKIVHNLQNLGALANMFIMVKKYCQPDSVVINIDADDALIGKQALNVINANYQDPNVWFVYTRFLWQSGAGQPIKFIPCKQLNSPTQTYRVKAIWRTSHMRTYRQKLMSNSPLENYIQYRYNETSQKLSPTFHLSSADRFQIYAHLQMSGDGRFKYITDMLYYYEIGPVSKIPCYRDFQIFEQFKSRAKTPIKPLQTLESKSEIDYSVPLDNYAYLGLKNSYSDYQSCKRSSNQK